MVFLKETQLDDSSASTVTLLNLGFFSRKPPYSSLWISLKGYHPKISS